jgi:large subunit ribosomal protein L37Ae
MRDEHACPECGATRVSRDGTGIWECSRCDYRFTGGSYRPQTPGGRTVQRSIRAALSEGGEEGADDAPAPEDVAEMADAALDEAEE